MPEDSGLRAGGPKVAAGENSDILPPPRYSGNAFDEKKDTCTALGEVAVHTR